MSINLCDLNAQNSNEKINLKNKNHLENLSFNKNSQGFSLCSTNYYSNLIHRLSLQATTNLEEITNALPHNR